MLDLETIESSTAVVEECLNVQPDEQVLIVTDPELLAVGKNIALAANAAGGKSIIQIMPLLDSHGNEPLDVVAESMAAADVVFTCTTQAITHTRARLNAAEAGARIAILRGVTERMMMEGAMTADFVSLKERTREVRDILNDATNAHITSKEGTDVKLSLDGCPAFALDGYHHEDTGFASLPPGESPTHPKEGTTEGEIVMDVSMDTVGLLDEPIHLSVENGHVVDVSGGHEARQLAETIENADENATNIAEFAIGTNPKALFIGNQSEDKIKAGTVHFAVGDNESLGGNTQSNIHLDGVLGSPTVKLDDEIIVDDGELLV